MVEKIIKVALKQKGYSDEQIEKTKISLINESQPNLFQINIPITPKKFIEDVLIKELGEVVKISPWLGFISISSGIEFLGKCIDTKNTDKWDTSGMSKINFNDAIKNLNSFIKYRPLLNRSNFNLYNEFRCGLVHSCAPKANVSLSHGTNESANLDERKGVVNFNADELYVDFKSACEEVINMDFPKSNKMNFPKLYINLTLNLEEN